MYSQARTMPLYSVMPIKLKRGMRCHPNLFKCRIVYHPYVPDKAMLPNCRHRFLAKIANPPVEGSGEKTDTISNVQDIQHRAPLEMATLTILLLFILIASPLSAQANETVLLPPENTRVVIGPYLEQLEDPEGIMTLADVQSPPLQSRFQPNTYDDIHIGHTRSAWWFRFKCKRAATHQEQLPGGKASTPYFIEFDKPGIHSIDLYVPQKKDLKGSPRIVWTVKETGMACLLYTSPSPRDRTRSRMPSSA